ncbi:MAG: SH3 domain-containing protein [Chloroflexaceae bacterium]|nr:SH3 domain-containing protein [Chloroflexaceae bacterium]
MKPRFYRYAGLAMALLMLALALPWVMTQAQSDEQCFPETGQCISGRIRQYWEQNGGQPIFGLPISPIMTSSDLLTGRPLQVQWFENYRMEWHPENTFPDDVLLSSLGVFYLRNEAKPPRDVPQAGNCMYFETGYNVCGDVLTAWRTYGLEFDGVAGNSEIESRALFGAPLTGGYLMAFADGSSAIVQWFERARFEVHADGIRLGRMGYELYTQTPPFPATTTLLPVTVAPAPSPVPQPQPTAANDPTAAPDATATATPRPGSEPTATTIIPTLTPTSSTCDPRYPDVCIPPPPPDLDCNDITPRNFRVEPPGPDDPHHFDGDGDGIGCESQPDPTATPPQEVLLLADVVASGNVYASPSVDAEVRGQVNVGDTVELFFKTTDSTWYQIEAPGGVIGWVEASLLSVAPEVDAQVPSVVLED